MQVRGDFGCHLSGVDKVMRFVPPNQQVADNYRIAVHITSPQVQSPCDFVEGREQQAVGFGLLHFGAYGLQLFGTGAPGILRVVDEGGGLGHFRSSVPDLFHRVGGAFKPYPFDCQLFPERAGCVGGKHPAVNACGLSLFQSFGQKSGDGGCFGQHLFVEVDAGAFYLSGGLQEVARVGPQAGFVPGDHYGASRTGKTGNPFPALPVGSHVFA